MTTTEQTSGNITNLLNTSTNTVTYAQNTVLAYYQDILNDTFYTRSSTSTKIIRVDQNTGGILTMTGSFSVIPTIKSINYSDAYGSFTTTGHITVLSNSVSTGSLNDINIVYGSNSIQMTGQMNYNIFGSVSGTVTRMAIESASIKYTLTGDINITNNTGTVTGLYVVDKASNASISLSGSISYSDILTALPNNVTFASMINSPILLKGDDTIYANGEFISSWFGYNGNDKMYGTATRSETLYGGAGNDALNGYGGNDVLIGGTGNDTYTYKAGDTIVENANQGTDTVNSFITFTLTDNFENLTLVGNDQIDGYGNAQNNTLDGSANNSVNTLSGGDGDDEYIIGLGDIVVENADQGNDTVYARISYSLGDNLEILRLEGSDNINATGNALDNRIIGNYGNNTLDGALGNDTLEGYLGDDTYIVDAGDIVLEAQDNGLDTVQSNMSWTLGDNLEKLVLTGTSAIDGTGNSLANIITSNAADNTLAGLQGNDTYIVDIGDIVLEDLDNGLDTVQSIASWILGDNLENLVLTGSSAIDGTGNSLANTITGNASDNTLDGGSGIDTLTGGTGNDTYILDTGDIAIEGANAGTDTVRTDFTRTLAANFENLVLTGASAINGTGNALANILDGSQNTAANKLIGGAGNDTYIIGVGDTVTEAANAGVDTVNSFANYTLGANLENLTLTGNSITKGVGNALSNILDGSQNTAANSLVGGAGNDTYIIDAGDTVTEAAAAGTDTVKSYVSWTLGANLEHLTLMGTSNLNGTGNALNNKIIGNAGDNILNGGAGADILQGGTGNDTYLIDNLSDAITEAANAGTDSVMSSRTWALGANLENLTLTGAAIINGTGNTLDNIITGNNAANTLRGGGGNDTLSGGAGADQLYGDAGADVFKFDITTLNSVDTIRGFSIAQGDALDIHDLLSGFDPLASAITDFVQVTTSGLNSVVKVDIDGTGTAYGWKQVALLTGVTGLTDEESLLASNIIIAS